MTTEYTLDEFQKAIQQLLKSKIPTRIVITKFGKHVHIQVFELNIFNENKSYIT